MGSVDRIVKFNAQTIGRERLIRLVLRSSDVHKLVNNLDPATVSITPLSFIGCANM